MCFGTCVQKNKYNCLQFAQLINAHGLVGLVNTFVFLQYIYYCRNVLHELKILVMEEQ